MSNHILKKYNEMPLQLKASFWFTVSGFIQKGISLLTTPVFSRLLTTEEFGVFGIFNTWQNIIIIIASLNLAAGVYLRGLIKYEDDSEIFTKSLQSLYLINTIVVFFIYFFGQKLWNRYLDLPTTYMYVMFIDIVVQVSFQFWSARERVGFRYKHLVLVTILNAFFRPVCGIICIVLFDNHIDARIYSMVAVDVLTFGYFFIRMFSLREPFISTKYWKYALAYNLPLIPHYLSQIVLNQSDRIMINSITGKSDAGIYNLAYSAAAIMVIVNQAIINTYSPWMYKKIKDKEYQNIGSVSMTMLVIVGSANLALIMIAPEAIRFMAPSSYYQAIWVVPPVAMSVYFMFMYSLFSNFEFYYENTRLIMMASVLGAILNIVLNYYFIRLYGFLAAGYTTLVCYFFYCVFHYFVMKVIIRKQLNNFPVYNIWKIVALSAFYMFASGMFMFLYNYPVIRYAIIVISAVVVCVFRNKVKKLIMTVVELKNKNKE